MQGISSSISTSLFLVGIPPAVCDGGRIPGSTDASRAPYGARQGNEPVRVHPRQTITFEPSEQQQHKRAPPDPLPGIS